MALKQKIDKKAFDKLSKDLQAEYIEDGDGYRLDVEGGEDTGALKRAKDRETQLRKDAETKAADAQAKLDELNTNDAKKSGDIETLEKKWGDDLQAEKDAHAATTKKYQGSFKRSLVDSQAKAMASKISKVPGLLSRVIGDRLTVDFDGDDPVTKVLDANGKVSDMSIEDLQKEFVANPDYADIIIASKSSGGAGKTKEQGGGAPTNPNNNDNDGKPIDLATMDPKALGEHMKAKKEAAAAATEE